jgi:hypothetical protein
MDAYAEKDYKGRLELLKKLLPKYKEMKYKMTEDTDVADLLITGTTYMNQTYIYTVEIKRRTYDHDRFSTVFLEKKKYDALVDKYGEDDTYYVMLFDDLTVWFPLSVVQDHNIPTTTRMMRKNNIGDERVNKEVFEIPIRYGKIM